VKCFTNEVPDLRERYAAISDHLARVRLPYTVDFKYVEQGIRIRGHWFPIVKMEWLNGKSLSSHLEGHLYDAQELHRLAQSWMKMIADLRDARIAHGDLQHGNIMVARGQLRLIDYDGMFVPSLAGKVSHELGHINYQHPKRQGADFGAYIDHFSAWIIYWSIKFLIIDPTLWISFNGGDDCLLFRGKDFSEPNHSKLLERLRNHENGEICEASESLIRFLNQQLAAVAPLSPTPSQGRALPRGGIGDSWLEDHTRVDPKPITPGPLPPPQTTEPWWRQGATLANPVPTQIPAFRNRRLAERVVAAISGCLVVLLTGIAVSSKGSTLGILAAAFPMAPLALLVSFARYRRDPALSALNQLRPETSRLAAQTRAKHRDLERASQLRKSIEDAFAVENNKAARELRRISVQENAEDEEVKDRYQTCASSLGKRRQAAEADEARETREETRLYQTTVTKLKQSLDDADRNERAQIRRVENEVNVRLKAIDAELAGLGMAEQDEVKATLRKKQQTYVKSRLKAHRLSDADIPGIGLGLKTRLVSHGYQTAYDVSRGVFDVPDIGLKRMSQLLTWKRCIEAKVGQFKPKDIGNDERLVIRQKYRHRESTLRAQRDEGVKKSGDKIQAIRTKQIALSENLKQQLLAEEQRHSQASTAIRARYQSILDGISVDDRKAQEHAQQDRERIKSRYAKLKSSVREGLIKVRESSEKKIQVLDHNINALAGALALLESRSDTWKQALDRATTGITFVRYLARTYLGRG